jgi:hypothetical protein
MKLSTAFKTALSTTALLLTFNAQQAQAGTLYNGWNYSIDSFNDGTEGSLIGAKSKFEFYGMAYKQTKDKVYFAINSNLAQTGYNYQSALNGSIGYGDLLLNFAKPGTQSGVQPTSLTNGNLYGIRFDGNNDTKFTQTTTQIVGSGKTQKTIKTTQQVAPSLGLYQNVTATSLTTKNAGYSSLQQHADTIKRLGGVDSYGDMAVSTDYFGAPPKVSAPTHMASGNFLGNIQTLTDFTGLGLDFGKFKATGSQTFGFSIDRSFLNNGQNGSFVASLFAECGNDGIVLAGELTDVPEPSMMAGLAVVGLLVAKRRRQLA